MRLPKQEREDADADENDGYLKKYRRASRHRHILAK